MMGTEPVKKKKKTGEEDVTRYPEEELYFETGNNVILIDWEEKVREHEEKMRKEEEEGTLRRERALKKEKSWELLRICKEILRENCKSWERNAKEREEEKRTEEEKSERMKVVQKKKEELQEKLTQMKILQGLRVGQAAVTERWPSRKIARK